MKWIPLILSFIAIAVGLALFCVWVVSDSPGKR